MAEDPSVLSVPGPVTFDHPPVNEVAFSVQLEGAEFDEVRVLADYWPKIRGEFPGHQKQPPLLPVMEDFSPPAQQAPVVNLGFVQGAPPVRYWFTSSDGTRLVQVQADRFVYNWRQVPGGEDYPRFETIAPEFEAHFRRFLEVVSADQTHPSATWCELTYINHVEALGGGAGIHGPLSRVLNALNPDVTSPTLPPIEDTQLQQRFRILDDVDGATPIGRFYITAVPAFRATDSAPIYVVTLIARARPQDTSLEGIFAFFQRARGLIVMGFTESTRPEMHELWGLHR